MPCEGAVHLRRAVVADAAGIARVHLTGWQKAHVDLVPKEYLACMRAKVREESWREELAVEAPDRTPWVALVDDRVVGFARGGITRDDDADPGTAEIYQVYVDPECWRRGIGTALLRHVLRDLHDHGFTDVAMWIISANSVAREWARNQGWSADGATRDEDCGDTQVGLVRYQRSLD